jgi:hypothetical protein
VNGNLAVLAYTACGYLIVVYTWGRSHVPPSSLGLVVLVYLALGGPFSAHGTSATHQQAGGFMLSGKIAHVQLVTIGMTVWLMQRRAYFSRTPGDPPRGYAYLANSIIAVMIAPGISLVFRSGDAEPLVGTGRDLRVVLLSFPQCAAVAFFRDHWAGDTTRPAWLRRAETAGCASVMILSTALLFFGELFPFATDILQGWRLAILITLLSASALVIGGCVPRVHHSVPQAATSRRKPSQLPVPMAWGHP